eukprot:g26258.t1
MSEERADGLHSQGMFLLRTPYAPWLRARRQLLKGFGMIENTVLANIPQTARLQDVVVLGALQGADEAQDVEEAEQELEPSRSSPEVFDNLVDDLTRQEAEQQVGCASGP